MPSVQAVVPHAPRAIRVWTTPAPTSLLAAAEQARWESGDLYQFARQINDSFPLPRKLAIVELLWEVVYSDGTLEAHEDALMHKMGNLLGIRLEDLMALKRKVRGRMPG